MPLPLRRLKMVMSQTCPTTFLNSCLDNFFNNSSKQLLNENICSHHVSFFPGTSSAGKALWAKVAVYDRTAGMGAAFYMSCLGDSRGMYARMQSCDSIGGEIQFGGWDAYHFEGRGASPYNTVPLVGFHLEGSGFMQLSIRLDFLSELFAGKMIA
jgi:hypothetical protein